MPKVPVSDNVVPFAGPAQGPQPSQTDFAMAAALMHQEGKLFAPAAFMNSPALRGKSQNSTANQLEFEESKIENKQRYGEPKDESRIGNKLTRGANI